MYKGILLSLAALASQGAIAGGEFLYNSSEDNIFVAKSQSKDNNYCVLEIVGDGPTRPSVLYVASDYDGGQNYVTSSIDGIAGELFITQFDDDPYTLDSRGMLNGVYRFDDFDLMRLSLKNEIRITVRHPDPKKSSTSVVGLVEAAAAIDVFLECRESL